MKRRVGLPLRLAPAPENSRETELGSFADGAFKLLFLEPPLEVAGSELWINVAGEASLFETANSLNLYVGLPGVRNAPPE